MSQEQGHPVRQDANAIKRAISRLGGVTKTAHALNPYADGIRRKILTRQRVHQWSSMGTMPAEWVDPLATEAGVSRTEIDPIVYPAVREKVS